MSELLKIHHNGQWELCKGSGNVKVQRDKVYSHRQNENYDESYEKGLLKLARNLGLNPIKQDDWTKLSPRNEEGIRQFQPDAKGNDIHYENWTDLSHELAHKLVTPEGQNHVKWGQHLADIADNPNSPLSDKMKTLHHETAVHFAEDHLNRLIGAKPQPDNRVNFATQQSADDFLLMSPKGYYKGGKLQPNSELKPHTAQIWQSAQDHAKQCINDHLSGHRKFDESGKVIRVKPLAQAPKPPVPELVTPKVPVK